MAKAEPLSRSQRLDELLEGKKHRRKTITSPEGVPLTVQVATVWERIAAFTLDMIFMGLAVTVIFIMMLLLFFSSSRISAGMTLMLFLSFLVRNMYFLHFELAWQGRTPGKKICGLRVINRKGGALAPSAIIARNLTREVEFFLPMSLLLTTAVSGSPLQHLALVSWVLVIALLPLFNKDRLRAGDMIGGTQVIAMPKRALLPDLAMHRPVVQLARSGRPGGITEQGIAATNAERGISGVGPGVGRPGAHDGATGRLSGTTQPGSGIDTHHNAASTSQHLLDQARQAVLGSGQALPDASVKAERDGASGGLQAATAYPAGGATQAVRANELNATSAALPPYAFTHEQLSVYGAFELQVLEDFLRKQVTPNTQKELVVICGKIMRKIGWTEPLPQNDVRRFLNDFYAAQRAELERGQLFGRLREDKSSGRQQKK